MPVRNALQIHVLIVVAVCLVSLLGNNVIKKCVPTHLQISCIRREEIELTFLFHVVHRCS